MGTKKPVACLILTLVFSAAAAAQQSTRPTHQTSDSGSEAQTGSVRGRIVLPSGAQVSEAVKVSLQTLRGIETFVYTDLQGAFEMRSIEPGEYTLEVEADRQQRFETATERILVQRGTPSVVTIYLKEKKSVEDSKSAAAVVSAGELDRNVPAAAVKEFDRASKAAKDGKAAEAVEHFRRAISIYPDYLMAHNDLGTQLMSLGKLDEAEEEFRRAIKIGPKVFNPQLNLGIILVQSHKFSEAATTLETALSLDASSPSAHFFAGLAFMGLDNLARAEKELKSAYELGGSSLSLALFHLGQLYMSQGKREEAARAFESYLRETPKAANAEQVERLLAVLRQP